VTLDEMFFHVANGGVFIVEDLHTSYWPSFGGHPEAGAGTTIGAVKDLIDKMNAWHYLEEVSEPAVSRV
jgi:hypothetical protein